MPSASFTVYRLNSSEKEFEEYCSEIINDYNGGKKENEKYVSKSNRLGFEFTNLEKYKLYTRETPTKPNWQFVLHELVSDLGEIENTNHSFVLLLKMDTEVFCITGGNGYLVLEGYKDYYFGLELLSKIIEPNDDIIKETTDRFFSGNRISGHNQYSGFVNINSESGLSNFFKQLNVFLSKEKIESVFGIEIDSGKKDYKFLAKDSINLGKSLGLNQLDIFLKNVCTLINTESLFMINPFYELNSNDPISKLLDDELEEEFRNLFSDSTWHTDLEIMLPSLNCESYMLRKKGTQKESDYDCNISEIKPFFVENFNSNSILEEVGLFKESFLKKTLIIGVTESIEISRGYLYTLIDFQLVLDDITYWLMDGKWLCLDRGFIDEVNNKFMNKVTAKLQQFSGLPELQVWIEGGEGDYNFSHNLINDIYVFDKILVDNIEICDLLINKDGKLYFIHVKDGLDGDARVLSAQIFNAMNALQNAILHDGTILERFYTSVQKKIGGIILKSGEETTMSKAAKKIVDDFTDINKFTEYLKRKMEDITFVFAFRPKNHDINKPETIKSTAAKMAMINIVDDVRQFDFKLEFIEIKSKIESES